MTIYATFLENEKKLVKGNYSKSFDVDFTEKGLKKMLSAIRVKDEEIIIYIADVKMYSKVRFSEEFKEYKVKKPISSNIFEENFNGDLFFDKSKSYISIDVCEKWQNLLGKQIYFCRNRELQLHLVREKDICSFVYDDWQELRNGLLQKSEIPDMLLAKMFMDDREIEKYDEKGMLKDEFRKN